jgi:hypothetical protein
MTTATRVHPALAIARDMRARRRPRNYHDLFAATGAESPTFRERKALYRHAKIEAGLIAGPARSNERCPVCGHVYEPAEVSE